MNKLFAVIPLAVLGIILLFSSWYTVDQTERGVILRNGAVIGTADPGLHFKAPIIDSVVDLPVSQQAIQWHGDNSLAAYSQDQQPATLAVSVLFHVPPADVTTVYSEFGGLDGLTGRMLARVVPQELKTVFGRYTAVTAIQHRDQLNADVTEAITKSIKGPLVIDTVTIENIDFSNAYEQSVEARMLAEVEVQKLRQNAEREKVQAQITVTQAQAEADAKLAQAKANAEAIRVQGEAQADAIKARGDALKNNPDLVSLTAAERWDGKLPTTMLPGGSVPFVPVK